MRTMTDLPTRKTATIDGAGSMTNLNAGLVLR
jgi:hypothetical protein